MIGAAILFYLDHQSPVTNSLRSSAGDGGQERDLVAVTQYCLAFHVFAIDGGGGHGGERPEPRNLPADRIPELPDTSSLGELPDLFRETGGVAKGREIQKVHSHRRQVYVRRQSGPRTPDTGPIRILTSDRPVR